MPITLSTIPGFSDLKDSALAANRFALGAFLSRINVNAAFGLVRLEFFTGIYKHGDVVALPTSPVDGYTYSRNELIYLWVPANTADPATGWASFREPWTMWYGVWNVDQSTGTVFSEIGYRGNDDHKDRQASTNDGVLQVFVIAQRQKAGLIMSATPAFTRHVSTDFFTNRALHTGLMVDLNQAAKLGICNTEVIYMGEFFNAATVPQPVSPIDGHTYAYADCMFTTSWRWTADTDGSGNPIKPAINKGQLQDWSASVTPSGGVRISNTAVAYELSGTHSYTTGKVAVFAFCQRPLGTTFLTAQTGFAEILDTVFAPGATLRASTMQQLNSNIGQALCSPEFFGPTNYNNGATIPVPTSPLDSYVYARSELYYIWDWANTGPSAVGSGRLSVVHGSINSTTGAVAVNDFRLNSGASSVSLVHEGAVRVIVVGVRSHSYTNPVTNPGPPAFGSDDVIEFYGPNDRQTQYLNKADGKVTVSTVLNTQASILPNQTITLTFTVPAQPSTLLLIGWLQQTLLRPDNTILTLLPSSDATNLVTNGDMEAGTLGVQETSWTNIGGNAMLTANDFVHGGSKAGKILGAATSQSQSVDFNLTGGQVYILEGWIKCDAMTGGGGFVGAELQMIIQSGITSWTILTKFGAFDNGNTTTPMLGFGADSIARGYTQFQCYFTPTANGVAALKCVVQNVSGNAWFDDIKVYKFIGGAYSGLTNSASYYIYPYIEVSTGLLKFANGAPPSTSPSDTFSQQAQFDGRIGVPPKKIIMPAAGGSSSDTGGGDGTCPEFNEPVTIQRYSDRGELLFEGVVPAREVTTGYESDDGLDKRGCFIKGWSFKKLKYVFRAVHRTREVHCAGWMIVKGRRLTPCEAVWYEGKWLPAWKIPGSVHDDLVSCKMDIEVEADWDDEHNYLVDDMIIHNTFVLPC